MHPQTPLWMRPQMRTRRQIHPSNNLVTPRGARCADVARILAAAALAVACGGESATRQEDGGSTRQQDGGGSPSTVPIAPVTGDALYVVNEGDSSISVIDVASSTVIGTIEITGEDVEFPNMLHLSSDRREMYLAVPGWDLSTLSSPAGDYVGGAYVMRLDASTGETLAFVLIEGLGRSAAPAPDGTVWIGLDHQASEPRSLLVLDGSTLATLNAGTSGGLGRAQVTFPGTGALAFVTNPQSDTVMLIDVSSPEDSDLLPVGDGPSAAWPADDGLAYVTNEIGESISVIDPISRTVIRTHALGFAPAFAAVVDGELWVTDVAAGRVVFLDKVTGDALGEVATGAGARSIAVAVDDAQAWVTNRAANTVSRIDSATHAVTATIEVGAAPNGIIYRAVP